MRVLAHAAYGSRVAAASDLIERLRVLCGSEGHQFWADTISLRDKKLFDPAALVGSRQLTDIYLLGLATAHGGTLASFDRSIPVRAVVGARRDGLEIIGPAARA